MDRQRVEVRVPAVRDFYNRHVLTFPRDAPIRAAVQRLLRRGFSGAPVVDAAGQLVGVLSEVDCIRILAAAAYEGWQEGTVGDHMTTAVETVELDTDVFALASKLASGERRRFPVVEDGSVVGIITRRDVLGALEGFCHEQETARRPSTYELIAHRRNA